MTWAIACAITSTTKPIRETDEAVRDVIGAALAPTPLAGAEHARGERELRVDQERQAQRHHEIDDRQFEQLKHDAEDGDEGAAFGDGVAAPEFRRDQGVDEPAADADDRRAAGGQGERSPGLCLG